MTTDSVVWSSVKAALSALDAQRRRAVVSRGMGHRPGETHLYILRVEPDDLHKKDNKSPFRWIMKRGRPIEKRADEDDFKVFAVELSLGGT